MKHNSMINRIILTSALFLVITLGNLSDAHATTQTQNNSLDSFSPLTANLNVSPSLRAESGNKVALQAIGQGGSGVYQYKFIVQSETGKWYLLKNYSSSNTYTWIPGPTGNKTLYVDVKDSTGKVIREQASYTVTPRIEPLAINLTASPAGKAESGSRVNLTAKATGGSGDYQYKYIIRDNAGKWYLLKNYSSSNTFTWTPGPTGNKTLYVDVKDSTGKVIREQASYTVTPRIEPFAANLSASPAGKAESGSRVNLTAKAAGGSGGYQYKYIIRDNAGKWYLLKNYSSSNTFTWTPGPTGNKTLYVDVKDSTGKVIREQASYTVTPRIEPLAVNLSASPAGKAESGSRVNLTAKAAGGSGGYQYKYIIRDNAGKWYLLKNYSSSNTFTWTPGPTGNKTLYVDVKDSTGKVIREQASYTVTPRIEPLAVNLSASPAGKAESGSRVNLTAKAAGGSGDYQYKYIIRDNAGKWYLLKNYSSSNTFTWTPGPTGAKTLYVDVKDGKGRTVRTKLAYTVNPKVNPKEYQQTHYDYTLNEAVQKQVNSGAKTDSDYPMYIYQDALKKSGNQATVINGKWNVRGGPGTNFWMITQVNTGKKVKVIRKTGSWYQVDFQTGWINASPADVRHAMDPVSYSRDTTEYFQFLKLSAVTNVYADEVNSRILSNKGILSGKAEVFLQAARNTNINEIYLISHALHETGNGRSELANGVVYNGKTVYNMFGIGANDSDPIRHGADFAYSHKWFTPEAAILGGAQFIGQNYIHNPRYQQNTLYKMRWNPAAPASHQYATDIGWAVKQTYEIKQLYDLLSSYKLIFDVPQYK
ncbi:glucosaminidase domain-containing protein [Sporolactobacillus sp. Y61]|uniref:Glucosaminidase domain-containing protein n=1 Tax=Sporolactobacillus sp. Y61 TaxID=3160863 RepID=A0AAU8II50_9BACL